MIAGGVFRRMAIALAFASSNAWATFHLWTINEIYSDASGTVQFIEFKTAAGGQQFLNGHSLTSSQGAATQVFIFPSNLPGDTTNKYFLVGTVGFAALGIVAPDYVVPNGFLFRPDGTIDFSGVDSVSYASLPTDGRSIDHAGTPGPNSPTNFAGATGTLPPPPLTVPDAPTIVNAQPGNGQATIFFTAPANDGGTAITGYDATCNPGAIGTGGTSSPIVVSGLTNGTAYLCSVTATNSVGTSAPSASLAVTPMAVLTSFSGPSPTGTGTITASFTGGGTNCGFASAQLVALTGDPASPPAGSAPAGFAFPHGLFAFRLTGCTAASSITMTVNYPSALAAGTQYWKYGPTAGQPAPHWYVLPATITGSTAVLVIADGGLGDDDLAANGSIADQGGPGVPGPGGVTPIPTLGHFALILLAALLGLSGILALPRRG